MRKTTLATQSHLSGFSILQLLLNSEVFKLSLNLSPILPTLWALYQAMQTRKTFSIA